MLVASSAGPKMQWLQEVAVDIWSPAATLDCYSVQSQRPTFIT